MAACIFNRELSDPLYGEGELLTHKLLKIPIFLQTKTSNDSNLLKQIKEEASLRLLLAQDTITRLISFNCSLNFSYFRQGNERFLRQLLQTDSSI
jgi:hypothetical protein